MESPLSVQIGGDHYRRYKIQPVQFIATNGWDFFAGNVLKYLSRWREKGGLSDLQKALHYARLRIALQCEAYDKPRRPPMTMNSFIAANGIDEQTEVPLLALETWVLSSGHSHNIRAMFIGTLENLIAEVEKDYSDLA